MFTRVTHQTQTRMAQSNLQASISALNDVHQRATSGRRIQRPSDDPIATSDSLRIRSDLRAAEQYGRNITDGLSWLDTIDTTLGTVTSVLHRVRDLTVRAASDTTPPSARAAIAVEMESLRENLLSLANTTYGGRPIFAGNSDAGVAFERDLTFTGAPGSSVQRRVSPDTTLRVDADGRAVFGEGEASVFALLDQIVSDLRGGAPVREHLNAIDARMKTIGGRHADVGARQGELDRAKETLMTTSHALEIRRSEVEDVDMAKTLLDLQTQEVAYQAALQVTARVLQPSLMDFLS